ncbi:hypothetical protein [Deinococcus koreensis]|nr:hypothetical protein [Deinococcus koreensis]
MKKTSSTPDPKGSDNRTKRGEWTPDVSRAADEEMRKLSQESPELSPATESVDKSHLSVPAERHMPDEA